LGTPRHPAQVLRELVQEHGPDLATNPRRCRAFLLDLCPGQQLEINLLSQAAQANVAGRLARRAAGENSLQSNETLANLLVIQFATANAAALFAVEAWAFALELRETPPDLEATSSEHPKDVVRTAAGEYRTKKVANQPISGEGPRAFPAEGVRVGDEAEDNGLPVIKNVLDQPYGGEGPPAFPAEGVWVGDGVEDDGLPATASASSHDECRMGGCRSAPLPGSLLCSSHRPLDTRPPSASGRRRRVLGRQRTLVGSSRCEGCRKEIGGHRRFCGGAKCANQPGG
jgi:hypothetical protein